MKNKIDLLKRTILIPLVFAMSSAMAQLVPLPPAELARVQSEHQARVKGVSDDLHAKRHVLGLDAKSDFVVKNSQVDQFGLTHTRFQQRYKNVKVWGGEVIEHTDKNGKSQSRTNSLERIVNIDVTPRYSVDAALATVQRDLTPKGSYSTKPATELVIYPKTQNIISKNVKDATQIDATMVERRVLQYVPAYHVHVELNNPQDGLRHMDYLIDANTSTILQKWSSLETALAEGQAMTQYSGQKGIYTNSVAGGFEMRDMIRANGGGGLENSNSNLVLDYVAPTPSINDIFRNTTNTWGDGLNYVPGAATITRQTAAADVSFGISAAWDFFKYVMKRNGIDGNGRATYAVVHDPMSAYGGLNAYWKTSCFCMRFGDGNANYGWKNLTSLDIAAHELSHGVTATTAGLQYWAESGALNEATSDIFATTVEFYVKGGDWSGRGNSVSASAPSGNWTIGENVLTSGAALRYMNKPSLDGISPNAWYADIYTLDVHYSSGPMNRAFYFMSQGSAPSDPNTSSTYLPQGMTGVGIDHAARIWFRALSAYMTATTNYAGARQAAISAAKDLYGSGSPEEKAVWNAFRGINVGPEWPGPV